jgi:hypothetical protein
MKKHVFWLVFGAVFVTACDSGGSGNTSLNVTWIFESGDCAANNVQTVRVTWDPEGGMTQNKYFECETGAGKLGDFGSSGSFSIAAEGLDASSIVRAITYGTSVTVSGGGTIPIDLTLHPAPGDVTITWTITGEGNCPAGVILPYYITLYKPPAEAGGALTETVDDVKESCATGQATLPGIAPGNYVVELDSRAVTPAVRGTEDVTVVAGEDVQVDMQL